MKEMRNGSFISPAKLPNTMCTIRRMNRFLNDVRAGNNVRTLHVRLWSCKMWNRNVLFFKSGNPILPFLRFYECQLEINRYFIIIMIIINESIQMFVVVLFFSYSVEILKKNNTFKKCLGIFDVQCREYNWWYI